MVPKQYVCLMCTQESRVLNALLVSLLFPIHDVNLQLLQAEEWSSGSRMIIVNMSVKASNHPANKAAENAIVDKCLCKKRGQYFIFMVALDAASSFVLFHAN